MFDNRALDNISREFFNLKIGSKIKIHNKIYTIDGYIVYEDSGYFWKDYKISDGNRELWFCVEFDDELELAIFNDTEVKLEPNKKINFRGITYEKYESSTGKIYEVNNIKDANLNEEFKYHEYEDDDEEKYLSIEDYDGEIFVSLGDWLDTYDVELI